MAERKLYHTLHGFNYVREGQEDEFITGSYNAEDLENIMSAEDLAARIEDGHLREEIVPVSDELPDDARLLTRTRTARKKGDSAS